MPTDEAAALGALVTPRGPGPAALAFTATALLLVVTTRIYLSQGPYVIAVDEWHRHDLPALLAAGALATFALAHAGLVAVAVRCRSSFVGAVLLLLGCLAISAGLAASNDPLIGLVERTLPEACASSSWGGPAGRWNPFQALIFGTLLLPFLFMAHTAREAEAGDARARYAWGVGGWLLGVAAAIGWEFHGGSPTALAMALPGLLLLLIALRDTDRRVRLLAGLVGTEVMPVGPAAPDDPDDLRPVVTFPGGLASDGVLRVFAPATDGAYRAPRLAIAVARYPLEVDEAARRLRRRLRSQGLWLIAALAVTGWLVGDVLWSNQPVVFGVLTIPLC